MDYQ